MRRTLWTAAACVAAILAAAGTSVADEEGMGGAAPASPAPAPGEDVLVLKDGTEVRGRITAEDDTGYAVKVNGSLRVVEKSNVAEVRRGAPAPEGETEPAKGDRKMDKERRKDRKGGEPDAVPLTEEGRAWAKGCLDRLLSADPAIQRSAAEALRALGPAVVPFLREARDAAADETGKKAIERVLGSMESMEKDRKPRPDAAKPGQPGRGPAMLERVRTELALDDATSRTVGKALLDFGRETREVMEDARDGLITYEDARTKATGLRGKLRDGLKGTLSEEQLVKLDGILDEMGKRMGGGPPPKKDAPKDGTPPAK
jgi:hypothetical protein